MVQIYYTIDLEISGWPVLWLDASGIMRREEIWQRGMESPADVSREFKVKHPGASYLKPNAFYDRVSRIRREKEQIRDLGWERAK